MDCGNKHIFERDVCRSHSARSEKDLHRICPTKLSKRELGDLYFTLFDNNVELKKTVNNLREKITSLSTKLLRLQFIQKQNISKDNKCCISAQNIIEEQKNTIQELTDKNTKLIEKIRHLNMRLCSTRLFSKKSSYRAPCSSASSTKDKTSSPLQLKKRNLSMATSTAVSSTFENNIRDEEEKDCQENKCRSKIDELKQKIVDLQEELSLAHQVYERRISDLQEDLRLLQADNSKIRIEREISQRSLQERDEQAHKLIEKLQTAQSATNDLATDLNIEKHKVIELGAQVKAAEMSNEVVRVLENQLVTESGKATCVRIVTPTQDRTVSTTNCCEAQDLKARDENEPLKNEDQPLVSTSFVEKELLIDFCDSHHKYEDSEVQSHEKESIATVSTQEKTDALPQSSREKHLIELNKHLMKRMLALQVEMDAMKVSMQGPVTSTSAEDKTAQPIELEGTDDNSAERNQPEFEGSAKVTENNSQPMEKLSKATDVDTWLNETGPREAPNKINVASVTEVTQTDAIVNDTGNILKADKASSVQEPSSSISFSSKKTYMVKNVAESNIARERSISPNNTENDVESITDTTQCKGSLESLSFGENRLKSSKTDKATSTEVTTSSETQNNFNHNLSDGEIPEGENNGGLPDGHPMWINNATDIQVASLCPKSTTAKVEEALEAISQELAKCRILLLTQKQTEVKSIQL